MLSSAESIPQCVTFVTHNLIRYEVKMRYDITFIGHMCRDEVTPFGGERYVQAGSALLCGAMVAPRASAGRPVQLGKRRMLNPGFPRRRPG